MRTRFQKAVRFQISRWISEEKHLDEYSSVGRTYRDSPEVDNTVIIDGHHPIGEFLDVKITDASEYELEASPLK